MLSVLSVIVVFLLYLTIKIFWALIKTFAKAEANKFYNLLIAVITADCVLAMVSRFVADFLHCSIPALSAMQYTRHF